MSKSHPFRVLLIHPPVDSPAIPPWGPARASAYLSGQDLFLEHYDANLDFFLNFLLTPKRLGGFVDLIRKREKQGVYEKADPSTASFAASLLGDLTADPEQWRRKIAGVERSVELLRTEEFYQPQPCMAVLKDIGDLLDLASLAFSPSRIGWGRFHNTTLRDWGQVKSFVRDKDTNPFLSLCRDGLSPRLAGPELRLLIIFVSAPDQIPAALTMARFSKKQRPALHVALLGNHRLLAGARAFCDSLLPEDDPESLMELIAGFGRHARQGEATGPDFSGLPLKDYLTPGLVLPLRGATGSGPDPMPPSRLFCVMLEQERNLSAQGFLSRDTRLAPAYMAKLAGEMAGEQPPFCLSLACALDTSAGPDEMVAAHRAGVRLIQWRDPEGRLESLTRVLWDVSRAGIWNHVMLPAETDNSLVQGLTRFMAANPNIVHSWLRRQPAPSPFAGRAEGAEKTAAAYTQVATLPGQPLWHRLSDPVHLLLYVNQHGVKEVMRWRVRDDGRSVYSLGQNLTYHFAEPTELTGEYMDEISRMVEAGGSVGTKWVRYNLERAFLIGYVLEEGVIVGNSCLKRPRREYVETVNRQAGLDLSEYLERGYTSVRPEYRGMGIGTKLLEGLTARVGNRKLFSIIGADNLATQKMALRNQTKQVATFFSKSLGKEIGVWIPAWMLED